MPGIVEFPQLVQRAVEGFADLFHGEPQRRHFAEYLTGLFIAERKTVSSINREFARTTDQSCLNRFLTEADWDVEALNERRLDFLQQDVETCYCERGVIAIDNVLIDHSGQCIEDVGWFWDHAEGRNKIAHDYLFANYVCPSGKHYPLEFRRFRKESQCEQTGEVFENHTRLCLQLIDWVCERNIPGDFTWDSYFSNAEIMNHTHEKVGKDGRPRGYVGDLKTNRKVEWKGKLQRLDELAASIDAADKKEIRRGNKRQWYFTFTCRIPQVKHKVRIVILWDQRRDGAAKKMLVTNRVRWEVVRILKVYRCRWTGTETFHRDGKQELGMGDCQLRSGEGQTRHMYLVMLAYSLLMSQLQQDRAQEWALCKLMTIGESCRAMLRESLRNTIQWAIQQITENSRNYDEIIKQLAIS
jgi:hypothetical protein